MKKNYVLDTNVLLHDPKAIFRFEDNDVVIPIFVIEEIDRFKREGNNRGRNAREVSRILDLFRAESGTLLSGAPIAEGGCLRVAVPERREDLRVALDPTAADHAILQTALEVQNNFSDRRTILVTMDTNLRIRADALGIEPENYENQRIKLERLDAGINDILVSEEQLASFYTDDGLRIEDELRPNASVRIRSMPLSDPTLCRYDDLSDKLVPLCVHGKAMGVRAKNDEQKFAMDLLLTDEIKLVTMIGKAGTGKTLLALATALKQVVIDETYVRVLVGRPVIPLGKDIGYLPGSVDEKLNPWLQPIFDNLEYISINSKGLDTSRLVQNGTIQVEPLTYIRGRSLPKQFLIIDEAQNLTPHEVKTIITRSGEGTKVVLTGDPDQIDNPYVDSASNGLIIAADRFKGRSLAGHVLLTKGERSELADLAGDLL